MQQNYLPVGLGVGTQILERWTITKILGSTPLSVCVAADDYHREQRPHAVRVVAPLGEHEAEIVDAMVEECKALLGYECDNIARIFSCGKTAQGHCYIIAQLVNGLTVANIIAPRFNAGLSPTESHHILYWTARALASAHQHGSLHRNIRASNIVLAETGQVKLTDFGLGPLYFRAGPECDLPLHIDCYAVAPEVLRGDAATTQSDMYSFGVVAFEILTGRRPFESPDRETLRRMILEAPFPDVKKFRRGLPPHLLELISRCCARDASQRFQTMFEVVNLLEPFCIKDEVESCESYKRAYAAWQAGDNSASPPDSALQGVIAELRQQFPVTPKMLFVVGVALAGILLLLNNAWENHKTIDGAVRQGQELAAPMEQKVQQDIQEFIGK